MQQTLKIIAVAPFGSELALSWSDGVEQFLALEMLRRACPCAVCCGEPDVMGRENPKPYKLRRRL